MSENDYDDAVALIDKVEGGWKKRGIKTRRDWWHVLAGKPDGTPCVVAGHEFPVLWAAQKRQQRPITKNAIKRNRREVPPPVRRSRKA